MKALLMFTALVAAVLVLLAPLPKPVSDVPPAVIQIAFETVEDGKPTTRVCSAFYVNLIHLITADHCLPNDGVDLVNYHTGEVLRVVKRVEGGLALIEARTPASVQPLKLATRVAMGDRLFSFGYAYGEVFVGYQRNAAGRRQGHLILDGPLSPGMSGGPTVNENGDVVGVNQASNAESGVICLVPEIKELLNGR